VVNPQAPLGWASRNIGLEISHDSVVVQSGNVSLKSENVSEESGFFILNQQIPIDLISGKHVRLSGWIRTENITEGHACLWIRTDGYKELDLLRKLFGKLHITDTVLKEFNQPVPDWIEVVELKTDISKDYPDISTLAKQQVLH